MLIKRGEAFEIKFTRNGARVWINERVTSMYAGGYGYSKRDFLLAKIAEALGATHENLKGGVENVVVALSAIGLNLDPVYYNNTSYIFKIQKGRKK